MFGIPEWAIGTGFITMMFFAGVGLLYRFLPPEARARRRGRLMFEAGTLDEVERRLAAAEQMEARLAEVEERLDFAERLLAQQREAERLPGPPN